MGNKPISIKSNVIFNAAGNFFYVLSQWLIVIIATRQIGFVAGGELSLSILFGNLFFLSASFNSRGYQVSDIEGKYSNSNYIAFRIVTCAMSFAILILIMFFSNYSINQKHIIIAFVLYKTIEAIIEVFHGIFQKAWKMDIIFYSLFLRAICVIFCFYFAIKFTNSLLLGVFTMMVTTLIVCFFVDFRFAISHFQIKPEIDFSILNSMSKNILPIFLNLLFITVASYIPRLYLEAHYGSDILGIFSSLTMPAMIIQVSAGFVLMPLYTMFANDFHNKEARKLINTLIKCIIAIVSISILAIIVAHFLGDIGLKILYGDKILRYNYLLNPMIMTSILNAFQALTSMLNVVMRNNKAVIISGVIGLIMVMILAPNMIKGEPNVAMMGTNSATIFTLIIQILITAVFIFIDIRKMSTIKSNNVEV